MWPLGNNRWAYKLYSPLNILGSFFISLLPQWSMRKRGRCSNCRRITHRQAGSHQPHRAGYSGYGQRMEMVRESGAGHIGRRKHHTACQRICCRCRIPIHLSPQLVVLYAAGICKHAGDRLQHGCPHSQLDVHHISPLGFATVPGQDPLWIDSAIMISQARALGLERRHLPDSDISPHLQRAAQLLAGTRREMHSGGRRGSPATAPSPSTMPTSPPKPGRKPSSSAVTGSPQPCPVANCRMATPSNVPADSEAQWKSIIADVRQHFKGQIFGHCRTPKSTLEAPLTFLQDVDGIYLLWSASLSSNPSATKTDYANEAGRLLDNEVAPLASLLNKPLILAVAYPSAAGAASGCIPDGQGGCLDWNALNRPNADFSSVSLSLQTQADIYEAILTAVNSRAWITGFVSRGYYPPAALQDKSTSIHSKPVADILWYWYPRLLGKVQ